MSKHGSVTRLTVASTARTRLTTWTPDDFADLHELHADPAVMTFLRRGTPEPPEETHRRVDTYLREQESPGWTKWRVQDLSGQMIGRAGFSPFGKDRELGYTLAQHTWGEGLYRGWCVMRSPSGCACRFAYFSGLLPTLVG